MGLHKLCCRDETGLDGGVSMVLLEQKGNLCQAVLWLRICVLDR